MRLGAYIRLGSMMVVSLILSGPLFVARAAGRAAGHRTSHAAVWINSVWSRLMCALLGVRVEIRGEQPRGRFVLVSNHLSYLDIWVLARACPGIFVAKREIGGWPLFGRIASAAGTLYVDRDSRRDVVRAGREMSRCLESGFSLILFPEGRATNGAGVLPFLPSLLEPAAKAGVPCHGATLRYDSDDPGIVPSDDICWHDSSPLFSHIFRIAASRDIRTTVQFTPDAVRSNDRKELATTLHDAVARAFVPVRQQQVDG